MTKDDFNSIIAIIVSILVATGIAFAGSQGSIFLAGMPLFAFCIALSFIILWIAFIPAYILSTEKFFDLIGSQGGLSIDSRNYLMILPLLLKLHYQK